MKHKFCGVAILGLAWAASCTPDEREVQLAFPARGTGNGGASGSAPLDGDPGLAAQLEVGPRSVDLGWVTVGFPARTRVRLSNAGAAPLAAPALSWVSSNSDFQIIQNQCLNELAPGESCEVRLQLTPSRPGETTAVLHAESSGGGAGDVALSGLGLEAGDLILAPAAGSSEDFGGVRVGSAVPGVFRLTNPGVNPSGPISFQANRLEFSLLAAGGAPDDCVHGMTSLLGGQSCNLHIALTPAERGPVEATLTGRSASMGSVSLTLAGRGLLPGALESSSALVDFEGVVLGGGAQRSATFENGGDEVLTLAGTALAPVGAEGFSIQDSDCGEGRVLAGGEGCSVQVEFRPPRSGAEMTAELTTNAVEGQQRQTIGLRGIGLEPGALVVEAAAAGGEDFGPVLLEGNLVRDFQVSNPGAQTSGVLSLRASDGFEVVTPPNPGECVEGSTSLAAGERCSLRIRFAPTRREVAHGSLTVSSALAGAKALALTGRGIIPAALEVEPEINFGRVFTGVPTSRTLVVGNAGDEPLPPPALELTSPSDAQAMAFSYQSSCTGPLGFGEECEIAVGFTPAQAVPHSANLRLTSEPGGAATVLLLAEALAPGSLVLAIAQGGSTNFGDVQIGSNVSRSFTLTNPGSVPSGQLVIRTDSNRFEAQEGDCNQGDPAGLVNGASCSFSVLFSPNSSLEVVTNLSVQSSGAGQTGLELRGRGRTGATLTATGNRNLGRANIGQDTLTQPENQFTWTVNNEGDLTSGTLQLSIDNPTEFERSNDSCSNAAIPGRSSCQMTFRFRPSGVDTRTARVGLTDPTSGRVVTLVLTGVGVRLAALGQSCVNATCDTGGTCTGGVCCDRACDGTCQVCSAAGVCIDQTNREVCGNGNGRCFGVNRCLLPEGQACGQGGDCGDANCERRLNGQGPSDRICCLTDCDPSATQCNAQGQCEQPTLAAGAACGGAGNLPCAGGLQCKTCLDGASRCTPAGACCGDCGANRACIGGVCGCAPTARTCNDGRCIANNQCCETCSGGRSCNAASGNCECPNGQQFINNQCRLNLGAVCTANGTPCANECINGRCCEAGCSGLCRQCQTNGRCAMPADDNNCPQITCAAPTGPCQQAAAGNATINASSCQSLGVCKTAANCAAPVNAALRTACGPSAPIESGGCGNGPCSVTPICNATGACRAPVVSCGGQTLSNVEVDNCCSVPFPDTASTTPPGPTTEFCFAGASDSITAWCDGQNDCPTGTFCCLAYFGNFNTIACQANCQPTGDSVSGVVCRSPGESSNCPGGTTCTAIDGTSFVDLPGWSTCQ